MTEMTPVDYLRKAIESLGTGGQSKMAYELSKRLGRPVSQARVHNWLNRDGGAPAEVCPDIEDLTGVRCEKLCPTVNWALIRRTDKPAANDSSPPRRFRALANG